MISFVKFSLQTAQTGYFILYFLFRCPLNLLAGGRNWGKLLFLLSSPHTVRDCHFPCLPYLCLVSLPSGNNLPSPPPNNAIHIFLRGCCISQPKCLSQSKNSLPPKGRHPPTSPSLLHPAFTRFQQSCAPCCPPHSTHWCSVKITNNPDKKEGIT